MKDTSVLAPLEQRSPNRRTSRGPAEAKPTPERLMQFAWGYAPTLILQAALNHKVFDFLDRGPQTAEEIAAETGASARGMKAILNALVGLDFLRHEGERYALTDESAAFLVSHKPAYHGMYFTHVTRQVLPRWVRLEESVRTGKPVTPINHEDQGQQFFAEFVESLFPLSYQAARTVGEHLGIPRARSRVSVLDVGAGSGVWGIALAQLSPQVRIHAVDWPVVLNVTRRVALREGVADRLTTVAGDLLQADLGKNHHVATLGHILHSEGAERSRQLLKRIFSALAPGGTIVIGEFMPNEDRSGPPHTLFFAVNMLVHTDCGDTFTFSEIAGWLREAGFTDPRLLEAPAPSPLVLATRP